MEKMKNDIQKRNNKMADKRLSLSVTILNANGLNCPIK